MTGQAETKYYDTSPAPAIERLARIEGQSNFLRLLAGIEAGPDTTSDMAALAFSRGRGGSRWEPLGAIPEALEAHVAQSTMYRLPLMSIVWHAIRTEFKPKERDWPWMQGAIADAFQILRTGRCKPVEARAKSFRVDKAAYGALRKTARGVFAGILDRAENEFRRANRSIRGITEDRHTETTATTFNERARLGHFVQQRLASSAEIDECHAEPIDTHGIGMADRLGWDDRNAAPGPVTTLQAQPPAPDESSE